MLAGRGDGRDVKQCDKGGVNVLTRQPRTRRFYPPQVTFQEDKQFVYLQESIRS